MKKNVFYKIRDIILILLILFGLYLYLTETNDEKKERVTPSPKENFSITFLDVGEADCIIIQNNGEYALVDAGNNEDGEKIVTYMKEMGIEKFQYVFGTHAHEDHIGGMDNILRSFSVEHFYMPDVSTPMMTYLEILKELEKQHIAYETPKIGEEYKLSETMIKVLWVGDNEEDINSNSIILKLTYKNNTFLLTGDATSEVEEKLLEEEIQVDLLKVAHHGSKQSNSDKFLRKVHPKIAVISVGKGNDYGFPKKVVINKLKELQATIYRTDEVGTIIAYSDGNEITIETQFTDTNKEE